MVVKNKIVLIVLLITQIVSFSYASTIKQSVSFVLLVDESGSMKFPGHDPEGRRIDAAANFVYQLDDEDYIGVIGFGTGARIIVPLRQINGDRDKIIDQIKDIRSNQAYTMINSGLEMAFNLLNKATTEKSVVILLTDGQFIPKDLPKNVDPAEYFQNTDVLSSTFAEKGIPIFAIAFTKEANIEILRRISTITNGKTFRALVPLDIGKIYTEILSILPKGYSTPLYESGKVVEKEININSDAIIEFRVTAYKRSTSSPLPQVDIYDPHGKKVQGDRFTTNSSVMVTIRNPQKGKWRIKAYSAKETIDVEFIKREDIKVELVEPQIGEISRTVGSNLPIKIMVTPHSNNYRVIAEIEYPDGNKKVTKLEFNGELWEGNIQDLNEAGNYSLNIRVETPNGSILQRKFDFYVTLQKPFEFTTYSDLLLGKPIKFQLKVLPTGNVEIKELALNVITPDGNSNTLALYDDGEEKHGDSLAKDFIFSNIWDKTDLPGDYRISCIAKYVSGKRLSSFRKDTIISKTLKVIVTPIKIRKNFSGDKKYILTVFNYSNDKYNLNLKEVEPTTISAFLTQEQITLLPKEKRSIELFFEFPKHNIVPKQILLKILGYSIKKPDSKFQFEAIIPVNVFDPVTNILKIFFTIVVLTILTFLCIKIYSYLKLKKVSVDITDNTGETVTVELSNYISLFANKVPIYDLLRHYVTEYEDLGEFGFNFLKGYYVQVIDKEERKRKKEWITLPHTLEVKNLSLTFAVKYEEE